MIICSGTFGRIPFLEKARAAARAGFDGISIYAREYESGLRAALDDLGLSVAEIDGRMAWMPGQPGEEVDRVLDIAAELNARSVTVVEVTGLPVEGAVDAYAALCQKAGSLVMHIEPFPWSGIATVRQAADIVRAAGAENGGVIVDTWHAVRGGDDGVISPDDAATVVAAQVCDAAPVPLSNVRDEAMHHRLPPGAVARRIVAQLPPVPLEVEIYSDELHALPPDEIAALAYRALHGLA